MPATTRLAAPLAVALAVAGCGGGGGGSGETPPPDTTAPSITTAAPTDAETGVARDVAPRFTFSEAIDLATVTPASVVFEDRQGVAVAWEPSFDAATNVLTLTPAARLANYGDYAVTFGTGVSDLAGNGLAAARTFAFTTADDVAPGVAGTPGSPAAWATVSPVAFSWTAASDDGSGVASYRLEVATATDGTGTSVFSGDVGAVLSYAVSAADGQILHARVAAVDGAGNAGPWSQWSGAIGVDLSGPALSSGVVDAGAWDGHPGDATVAFGWGAATDGGSGLAVYEVEVALGATSGAVVGTASPTDPALAFDATALADGDVLFARVRALDVAGNASDWSAWSDGVTLDGAAPGAPGTPAGPGAFALASPVRFTWAAASDAVSGVAAYGAQVASATDGSGVTFFDSPLGAAREIDVPATDGQRLFARAAASDAAGFAGPWSPWSSEVVVDLQPPSAPGTPEDDGDLTETPAHFSWTAASDTNGVASYVLEVTTAPDGGGTLVYATNVGDVLAANVPAADAQTLYARVRAIDVAGRQGPWSASSNGIVVDRTGPTAPGAPQHDGAFSGQSVAFTWSPATAEGSPVASYLFEVSTSADFSSVVYSTTATTPSAAYPYGQDGQTVYARVRAQDGLGHVGPASDTSAGVTVDLAAPTVPGVPDDGGAAQAGATVHLSWAASTDEGSGVDHYVVEIREDGVVVASPSVAAPATSLDYVGSATAGAVVTARVRAFDALGSASPFSAWSDGIAINVAIVPGTPAAPTHEPPGAYADIDSVQFQWAAPMGGAPFDEYVLEIGSTPGAHDVLAATLAVGQTSYAIPATHGTTYFARVAARDSAGGVQGAFSPSSDGITVDRTPPSAPGTPTGTYASGTLSWTWPAATDPESGIRAYQITVLVNGATYEQQTVDAPATSYALTVPPWATTVAADVRAVNGAGATGASSAPAPLPIDLQPPHVVGFEPWSGGTVGTNVDVVIRFSEPMDRASVEGAFSLAWAGGSPRNGYVFAWNGESTEVRVVPDTQDPVGATNVDLLPEATAIVATVADTAKDLSGNGLSSAFTAAFTTADETAPSLLSPSVGGVPSPVPAASVQGGFALDLAFDEDMDPSRAGVSLFRGHERLEARYGWYGIQDVLLGAGTATYVLDGCPDLRVGDVVTVRDIQPPELQAIRAAVTTVNEGGPCRFTVASTASGVAYAGGGQAAVPQGNGARPAWTGPRTLSVVFEPWVSLAPGSDTSIEVWDVNDLSGNSARDGRTSLQVRKEPGTDTTPPALLTTLPRQGGAAPGARIAILRFTEPLDRSTLAGITAQSSSGSFAYELDYESEEFGPMVFVMPERAAPAGATITVHVPGTVKDLAGNAMGAAAELVYTVSPSADAGKPELFESLPPDSRPVWDVSDAQVAFADAVSGALDALDATTVGPEDVRVEDEAGRLSRGWRMEVEPGSAFASLYQPRGGFSGGWAGVSVTSVGANDLLDRAVCTTSQPHGMTAPGARVQVWMDDLADQRFNMHDVIVTDVYSPTEFAVYWSGPDAASVGGGWASVPVAKTYTVELLGVPGATGIADVHGNALDPQTFQVNVRPWGNRVPVVRDLRDLSVAASTSALGRSLEVDLGLRDADTQPVHVSVAVRVGGADVPLASYGIDVPADPWGSGWYRMPQDSGGPPMGDSDPALASLPSGRYTVTITLDDGTDTTTWVREVYLWSPADVPVLEGVDDGGTFRPMSPTRPPVVGNGPSPALRWRLADGAAPDFLGVYVATLDGVGDQGGGRVEAVVAPADVTGLTAPSPLAADVYLWTVVQQRFADGTNDPRSSAWALDFANPYGSLFVVGPDNDALGGVAYGAARIGFRRSEDGTLSGIDDATGTWAFEPNGATDAVFVVPSMTDHAGDPVSGSPQLFAYDAADGAFTATEATSGGPVPLPLPMRGGMGRAGAMFTVAQGNEASPSITAGAHRYKTSGFGTSLDGTFAFVQLEAGATAGAVQGASGSVGTATFTGAGSTTGTVQLTQNDGGTQSFEVPYTLDDDGLLALGVGGGGEQARGYVGGAPDAELAALAIDVPPSGVEARTFWLLMAKAYAWSGAETDAALAGVYRFADLSVETGGGRQGAHGTSGTLTFDGAGGFTWAANTPSGVELGAGTYAVDAANERVVAQVPANGGTRTLTFVVGPDFDTLLGLSTGDANHAEVLVVTR